MRDQGCQPSPFANVGHDTPKQSRRNLKLRGTAFVAGGPLPKINSAPALPHSGYGGLPSENHPWQMAAVILRFNDVRNHHRSFNVRIGTSPSRQRQ